MTIPFDTTAFVGWQPQGVALGMARRAMQAKREVRRCLADGIVPEEA
jgi:hypothetical protein